MESKFKFVKDCYRCGKISTCRAIADNICRANYAEYFCCSNCDAYLAKIRKALKKSEKREKIKSRKKINKSTSNREQTKNVDVHKKEIFTKKKEKECSLEDETDLDVAHRLMLEGNKVVAIDTSMQYQSDADEIHERLQNFVQQMCTDGEKKSQFLNKMSGAIKNSELGDVEKRQEPFAKQQKLFEHRLSEVQNNTESSKVHQKKIPQVITGQSISCIRPIVNNDGSFAVQPPKNNTIGGCILKDKDGKEISTEEFPFLFNN